MLYSRRALRSVMILLAFATISPAQANETPQASALTLEKAIAVALEKSPVLAAHGNRADAAQAITKQASALPNPEVSVEAENIYGDAQYEGLDNAEITYGVSQLVEMPGKRGNRIRVADAEKTKLHYTRDAARLDLIRDVTIGYVEVIVAQQEVSILEEEKNLAAEVLNSVVAKVDAGKEPPIQKNKAEIERSANHIALERAQRNLIAKKQELVALMGEDVHDFSSSLDSLPTLTPPEALEIYRARLNQTPDAKALDAEVSQAESALSLEKANSVPDPTLSFGLKDSREDDFQAFVAGVSFPLPVFNINRAGVERAGHDLNAVMMDKRGAHLSLDASLTKIYGDLNSAYSEAIALKETVLPGAEEAFSIARQGYDAGKFAYLEVLDAQRTLFDARKQANNSVLDYHRQRAALERMTALHAEQHDTQKE